MHTCTASLWRGACEPRPCRSSTSSSRRRRARRGRFSSPRSARATDEFHRLASRPAIPPEMARVDLELLQASLHLVVRAPIGREPELAGDSCERSVLGDEVRDRLGRDGGDASRDRVLPEVRGSETRVSNASGNQAMVVSIHRWAEGANELGPGVRTADDWFEELACVFLRPHRSCLRPRADDKGVVQERETQRCGRCFASGTNEA
jgi:hypothetical protein